MQSNDDLLFIRDMLFRMKKVECDIHARRVEQFDDMIYNIDTLILNGTITKEKKCL